MYSHQFRLSAAWRALLTHTDTLHSPYQPTLLHPPPPPHVPLNTNPYQLQTLAHWSALAPARPQQEDSIVAHEGLIYCKEPWMFLAWRRVFFTGSRPAACFLSISSIPGQAASAECTLDLLNLRRRRDVTQTLFPKQLLSSTNKAASQTAHT